MHVGGTGRAPNAIKCCERASPHTLHKRSSTRHVIATNSTLLCMSHVAGARLPGHISLAILTNGHRPYNILINLFDTQCNLFLRVEVARHTNIPRAAIVIVIVTHLHNRHIYIAVPTYRIQTQNQLFAHLYTQDVCIETLRCGNQFVSLNYLKRFVNVAGNIYFTNNHQHVSYLMHFTS